MTTEEKQLLLKDLCARLPYGVKLKVKFYDIQKDDKLKYRDLELGYGNICYCLTKSHWIDFKPYLRPMSSMTEEEKKAFDKFVCIDEFAWNGDTEKGYPNQAIIMSDGIDWLLSQHFDYRDLIEKGLALKAPKDMYKEK